MLASHPTEGGHYTSRKFSEGPAPPSRVFVVDLPGGKPKPVSPELNAVIYDACWSRTASASLMFGISSGSIPTRTIQSSLS